VRAAAHVILTPFLFAFGWLVLSFALPQPIRVLGWFLAVAAGIAYGWRNRRR
jgi:hypothetical protein